MSIIKYNETRKYSDIVRIGSNYRLDDIELVYEFTSDSPRTAEELYVRYQGRKYPIYYFFECGDDCKESTFDGVVGFTKKDVKEGRNYKRTCIGYVCESSIHRAYIVNK